MGQVVIDEDQSYTPGCYLICQVDKFGTWNPRDEKTTVLVQTDWDYPSLAGNFGWVPCKKCGDTDGTVDCAHRSASEMIVEAEAVINKHLGEKFEDPGYFEEV